MIWTSTAIANRKKVAILITFLFPDFQQLWSSAEGGVRRTWRGTVSGVGLGSMVWRRYGAVGRYAHGAMERHRCSVVNRHGYGVMGRCVPGIMKRTGAMVWKSAGAALWGDAGVVLGANAALRHGIARIRRCGVRPLWRHRKVGVRWRLFFGFAARMGKLQKVSKTS